MLCSKLATCDERWFKLKDASQHLKNVIPKASNIVNHMRKSIHATDILEGEKRFQAANATR